MADREKVIKGILQHCEGSMFDRCGECPYYEIDYEPFVCRDMLLNDLNELLKEQETANLYKCPNCGTWVSAENVVRCKDCRWGEYSKNARGEDMVFCYNGDTGIEDGYLHEPEWFCAEGERES